MEKQTETQKQDEVQIFKELGLRHQVAMREIEAVMDGMPYYPVTMRQLDKLFSMRWIGFLTFLHNWGVRFRQSPIASFFFFAILPTPGIFLFAANHFSEASGGASWMLMAFSALGLFSWAIWDLDLKDSRGLLQAKVEIEGIESTRLKIPYGAALRYKEAKDKRIFDGFVVAYPNVVAIERPLSRDPAILGFKNGPEDWRGQSGRSYFMVVYWDIEKDRERAIRKIKDFSRFKV